jgi:hypothetical protein
MSEWGGRRIHVGERERSITGRGLFQDENEDEDD